MRLGLLAAATAALLALPAPASAIDDSRGTPGFCPDDDGVTVVVDFGALGGDVIVRCAPGSKERDGWEALEDAGFEVAGTSRFGEGAVCRIEGMPAADEGLDVEGNEGYQESCVDMPPASAYWSYWGADNGGEWSYSQWGLRNRDAINGGFEGWSFSLNASRESPPAPRIDPVRPEDDSQPEQTDADGESQSGPNTTGPDRDGDSANGGGADDQASDGSGEALPMPKKRDTGTPPPSEGTQDGVEWSGGEAAEAADSTDEASSSAAPWAAAGVIVVLGVLIAMTAARRRTRRSG